MIDRSRLAGRTLTAIVNIIAVTFVSVWIGSPATSQAADPTVEVSNNVRYGTAAGEPLQLDIYRSTGGSVRRPALVLIHGGSWILGDKSFYRRLGDRLAKEGYVAFAVNYRLALSPQNRYPAALDDVQRAVRWIRAHADQYQVDPNRIGAMGDSAGAYLASLLGTRDTRANTDPALARYSSRVQCVVDLYGPTDFSAANSPAVNPRALGILENFLGKKPIEDPKLYHDASPAEWVSKRSAPFLIFHGTADPLVPIAQSQLFYARLRKAGVEATFVPMPGEGHGFRKPGSYAVVLNDVQSFLARHLQR